MDTIRDLHAKWNWRKIKRTPKCRMPSNRSKNSLSQSCSFDTSELVRDLIWSLVITPVQLSGVSGSTCALSEGGDMFANISRIVAFTARGPDHAFNCPLCGSRCKTVARLVLHLTDSHNLAEVGKPCLSEYGILVGLTTSCNSPDL